MRFGAFFTTWESRLKIFFGVEIMPALTKMTPLVAAAEALEASADPPTLNREREEARNGAADKKRGYARVNQ